MANTGFSYSSTALRAAACGFIWLMAAATPAAAAQIYFLTTGQSGAQTQIDINHTTSWSFTAGSAWTLGGGNFTMKDGSATTADIALSVYEGSSTAGTLRASINLLNSAFCGLHGGNCQSFASTAMHFASGNEYTFTTGVSYFVALTSAAPDVQSQAYFIKGLGDSVILDADNNPLNQTLSTSDVPEPATIAVLGGGLIALAAMRRRRPVTKT